MAGSDRWLSEPIPKPIRLGINFNVSLMRLSAWLMSLRKRIARVKVSTSEVAPYVVRSSLSAVVNHPQIVRRFARATGLLVQANKPFLFPESLGFREGTTSVHTSRTMMLDELSLLLEKVGSHAPATSYLTTIVEDNALGKPTQTTR